MRLSNTVNRVHCTDGGAFQAIEDLCSRPITVTISKRAKNAVKRSSVPIHSSKAMRTKRRHAQSSLALAPQAAHVTRAINQIK